MIYSFLLFAFKYNMSFSLRFTLLIMFITLTEFNYLYYRDL